MPGVDCSKWYVAGSSILACWTRCFSSSAMVCWYWSIRAASAPIDSCVEACSKRLAMLAIVRLPGQPAVEGRQVVLAVRVLNVGDQLRFLADEEGSAPQQVAGFAHGPRVDVRHREHPAAQQAGDLAGVDAVVLGLAAVDGFHVQGVAEREGDRLVFAQIGEPVPGEHALAADDEPVAEGFDRVEEGFGTGGQILLEDGLAVAGRGCG